MPKIAAGATNKNISLAPNGTGKVVVGTGAADATVQSDGDHNLILQTGNSTTSKIEITDGANGDVAITPNGTGNLTIDNIAISDNTIISTDTNGNIAITPNGTGEVDISKVDIDGGAIDGTNVTVGSGKTLDVSAGSLTTSTAQKQAIVDGASIEGFPSGTKMLFQQTAAPTGWTKVTTIGTGSDNVNDTALRVVIGTITDGVGGSVAFETAFASQTPSITNSAVTLTTAQIPTHTHTYDKTDASWPNSASGGYDRAPGTYTATASGDGGLGGGAHTHSNVVGAIDLNVNFVDVIIATKD